jgi:hypothetical protein
MHPIHVLGPCTRSDAAPASLTTLKLSLADICSRDHLHPAALPDLDYLNYKEPSASR